MSIIPVSNVLPDTNTHNNNSNADPRVEGQQAEEKVNNIAALPVEALAQRIYDVLPRKRKIADISKLVNIEGRGVHWSRGYERQEEDTQTRQRVAGKMNKLFKSFDIHSARVAARTGAVVVTSSSYWTGKKLLAKQRLRIAVGRLGSVEEQANERINNPETTAAVKADLQRRLFKFRSAVEEIETLMSCVGDLSKEVMEEAAVLCDQPTFTNLETLRGGIYAPHVPRVSHAPGSQSLSTASAASSSASSASSSSSSSSSSSASSANDSPYEDPHSSRANATVLVPIASAISNTSEIFPMTSTHNVRSAPPAHPMASHFLTQGPTQAPVTRNTRPRRNR